MNTEISTSTTSMGCAQGKGVMSIEEINQTSLDIMNKKYALLDSNKDVPVQSTIPDPIQAPEPVQIPEPVQSTITPRVDVGSTPERVEIALLPLGGESENPWIENTSSTGSGDSTPRARTPIESSGVNAPSAINTSQSIDFSSPFTRLGSNDPTKLDLEINEFSLSNKFLKHYDFPFKYTGNRLHSTMKKLKLFDPDKPVTGIFIEGKDMYVFTKENISPILLTTENLSELLSEYQWVRIVEWIRKIKVKSVYHEQFSEI